MESSVRKEYDGVLHTHTQRIGLAMCCALNGIEQDVLVKGGNLMIAESWQEEIVDGVKIDSRYCCF